MNLSIFTLGFSVFMSGIDYWYNSTSSEMKKKLDVILSRAYFIIGLFFMALAIIPYTPAILSYLANFKSQWSSGLSSENLLIETSVTPQWFLYWSILMGLSEAFRLHRVSDATLWLLTLHAFAIVYGSWQIAIFPAKIRARVIYFLILLAFYIIFGFVDLYMVCEYDRISGFCLLACKAVSLVVFIVLFIVNCIDRTILGNYNTKVLMFGFVVFIQCIGFMIYKPSRFKVFEWVLPIAMILLYIQSEWGIMEVLTWIYHWMD